jgi:hypothetical protein
VKVVDYTSEWRNPDDITRGCSLSSSIPSVATSKGNSPVSIEAPDSDEELLEEEEISDDTVVDNDYVRSILQLANLCILQPTLVNKVYDNEDRERNLFHLFFTKNYLETVCCWTAKELGMKGKRPCTAVEFYAFIGLELGMSLLKYNSIKSYWSKGCFIGHETFHDTMSRNRFESIRASARLTSIQAYDNEMAARDPLWSCRSFLDQFIRKSAAIAVPIGVSALDEKSCATKA